MSMGSGWIVDNVPYRKPCVVLVDPKSEKQCGNPASAEHTVFDLPICDVCYDAVRRLPEGILRAA